MRRTPDRPLSVLTQRRHPSSPEIEYTGAVVYTILVLGGYGFFGERICKALASDASIRLLVAGRHLDKATALAARLKLLPEQAVALDADDPELPIRLRDLGVATLIHAAGPFQSQQYAVATAAIQAGCHYIDLADGRDFVTGIESLDAFAREREVTVISGASSVPALSSAVVDHYLPRFERLESIELGISSGARTPGLATVQGVFSYGGKPIRAWRDGAWRTTYGWHDLTLHNFPKPLGARLLGSCDIPDLTLFPKRYPTARTITFHAGFADSLGHLVVWGLACLVRLRILPNLRPLAAPLSRVSHWLEPLFSDQGGMFVCLTGEGPEGKLLHINWNLLARQNHGPYIPCGAAIALARKLAGGTRLPIGAMPCVGLLTVKEFLGPLRNLDIREVLE
jgi:saccharopine dehydrogenase-like NADP-dependent oxidoreductase